MPSGTFVGFVGRKLKALTVAKFPKLPLWTDALIGDTYHLTPAEFGAYMRLLIAQWRSKDQKIPRDDISLGRMIGDPNGWHRLKLKVLPFFDVTCCGFYRQARCFDEYETTLRYAAQRSAAGTASALKRKNRDATGGQRNSNETPPPIPIKEVSRVLNGIHGGKKNGGSSDLPDFEKMARFQKSLALKIGVDGWAIVAAACFKSDPNHERALALCKDAATALNKGWPRQWPIS
jgi:uncharacterized protein YdaU (DUF1376 family)